MEKRVIWDEQLDAICQHRYFQFKQDSHIEADVFCGIIEEKTGKKTECNYQCSEKVCGELTEEKIVKIIDLLEWEWGYDGIREDVRRILENEDIGGKK